ncbi:hypothetical protein EU93_0044 [Prochlorococcus marinus str. MIT 9116]|uniref:DUF1400 domain-containing protein n=1 Tax=Prochlorococcus marinus str. MIT 9116 TaxID=167544 RepID=A0A0A1ZZM1_PROMR|nr:hypothetical protein [Prochlorococcus marinus]KGF93734.1 hypothetical protein EU93_0044 [Prochlorococcus marinus str. MIT 9116]
MKLRNLFLKIPGFVLLLVFCSVNSQFLAEDKKNCPEDFPSEGTQFIVTGENEFKLTITKQKFLRDALNNESLEEHIALLKLDVVEDYQKFLKSDVSYTETKYGGFKFTEKFDNTWNTMKKSIASMRDLGTCIEKDLVLFSGEWSSKSIKRVVRIIKLEEAFHDLFMLEDEDPKFKIDKLEKKYPTILNSEDPKFLRKVINNWKKNRTF